MTQETSITVRVKALRDAAEADLLAACNDLVKRKYDIPAYAATDREGDYMCPICYASIFSSDVTHEDDCPIGRIETALAAAIQDLIEQTEAEEREAGDAAEADLLAVAEKLDEFQRNFEIKSYGNKMPGNELYSELLMEIVSEARAAIAAAKGK